MSCEDFANGKYNTIPDHSFTLANGEVVRLCNLRQRFRLKKSGVYIHFLDKEVKKSGMRTKESTFTLLFADYVLKNENDFMRAYMRFCNWLSQKEPLLMWENSMFFAHRSNPTKVAGILFQLRSPDLFDARSFEIWALRCVIICTKQLESIERIKQSFAKVPEEKLKNHHRSTMDGLIYWEKVSKRILRLIDTMVEVGDKEQQ